jgi:hypothetical protein
MPPKETALSTIAKLQTSAPKKTRRSAREQALAPLFKRRDALKKRWDEADAAALRRHRDKFGPEHNDLEEMIAVINGGDDEDGPVSE